ncbi:emp24/gp25L/p24 family protein, partial [Salmonella sp. s51228]|uniref:emp24/gp25L/p24 family protein n=1 Tax=Salmonella sp. s51228 TaxID=3159652 RepID=UPI003980CD38
MKIPSRSMECFYQKMYQGNVLQFEYQVIHGGNFDIDCNIKDPSMRTLKSFKRLQDGRHTFTAEITGDYGFCFDNSYSNLISKLVFMAIESDAIKDDMEDLLVTSETLSEQEYDGKV